MLTEFQHFIREEKLFDPGDQILLAVSGGMDSVVMAELFHRAGYKFGIAHCNFGLRGQESFLDEDLVRKLAQSYRVTFHCRRFFTRDVARQKGISVQMAARELRYEWLQELSTRKGYVYIATAHHQDDEAETFLMNLGRGTGIAGLHGILPAAANLIRPMLFTNRQRISDFLCSQGLEYREDSSNKETKYRRNRIRHKIIPEFEKLNPSFRAGILETIRRVREAEAIYRQAVTERTTLMLNRSGEEVIIRIEDLKALTPRKTWLFELLQPFGFSPAIIDSLLKALDQGPGKQFFSATHRMLIDRHHLIIRPFTRAPEKPEKHVRFELKGHSGFITGPLVLSWKEVLATTGMMPSDPAIACLDADKLEFPLLLRKWRRGDFFYPLGMNGRKKLSDFFTDNKFSRNQKEEAWLLCSGEDIAWIVGYRIDDRFKVSPSTKKIMQFHLNVFL